MPDTASVKATTGEWNTQVQARAQYHFRSVADFRIFKLRINSGLTSS